MFDFSIFDFSVLGFGGLFCLVWAVGLSLQLPAKTKLVGVLFVGTSGLRLLWECFTLSGLAFQFPEFYAIPIPFLYLIGPSILHYYERLSGADTWKWNFFHFIPALLSLFPLLYWFSFSGELKGSAIVSILSGNWSFPISFFIAWVIGPKVSILIYSILISSRRSGEGALAVQLLPDNIRFFSLILLGYIFVMIFSDIIGYVVGLKLLYRYSAWSHSIAAILVYLYSKHNPQSMLEISGAIQTARYSQSKLVSIDSLEAIQKLNDLMSKESYYADEDLRLSTLAQAMKITPHQLSELVNVHFKMSFIHSVCCRIQFKICL